MRVVNDIYMSKLMEVQQRMDGVSARTGVVAPAFLEVFSYVQRQEPAKVQETYEPPKRFLPVSVRSGMYDSIVEEAASKFDVEPELIKAVIQAESSFREEAVSLSGAEGLMQLKPNTAAGLGVENSFDPEENILAGTEYLRKQIDRFHGDVRLALAAYNTGPGKIASMSLLPGGDTYDYAKLTDEECRYVDKVFSYYNTFQNM